MVISIAELCLALPNLYFRWVRDCNLKGEYATLNCTVHSSQMFSLESMPNFFIEIIHNS